MKEKLHNYESVYSCCDIVEHDPGSFWQTFKLSYGRRLEDVKDSKKYKTGEKTLPRERNGDEGNQLSRYLVNDDEARIFDAGLEIWPESAIAWAPNKCRSDSCLNKSLPSRWSREYCTVRVRARLRR